MKRIEKCPWCGTPVEVDTKRLDGGEKALAHIKRCEFNPKNMKRKAKA